MRDLIELKRIIICSPNTLLYIILYTIIFSKKITAFIIPNKLLLPIYLQVGNK